MLGYCSPAYSALACIRIGMSGSASFQFLKNFERQDFEFYLSAFLTLRPALRIPKSFWRSPPNWNAHLMSVIRCSVRLKKSSLRPMTTAHQVTASELAFSSLRANGARSRGETLSWSIISPASSVSGRGCKSSRVCYHSPLQTNRRRLRRIHVPHHGGGRRSTLHSVFDARQTTSQLPS